MKKRILSLFLAVVMCLGMMNTAYAVEPTVKLAVTADKASAIVGEVVTFAVTCTSTKKLYGLEAKLDIPSGFTYIANSGALADGVVDEIGGTSDSKFLEANKHIWLENTSTPMTITGTVTLATFQCTASASGTSTVSLTGVSGVDDEFHSFTYSVTGVDVIVKAALSGDLAVAIAKPAKGGTPVTTISGTNFAGSITWIPTVTGGKFAADTAYTAKVELTANTGYQFASDVNPTVTDATISDKSVSADGSTLSFKATFPKTADKTLHGIDIITNPALKLAVPTAEPNATATNEQSLAVTGVYDDGSGGPVAVNWEIMTTPAPTGVSISGNTLKVTNEAEDGTFMIKATSAEGYTDSETVTITKDTSVESAIVLTPPTSATVAVPKSDTPNKIDLPTAAVYDQYGMPMTGTSTITYAIDGTTPTGVTLAPGSGKIKVDRTAQAGEVKIVGKLGTTLTSDPVTYTITRETSQVTSVRVDAPQYFMDVPKVTELGTPSQASQQFNAAKVLDQYGQEMTGKTVTWRVANDAGNPVTGVSIDNNGLLTVTNEAPAITVYVTATCLGFESNKSKVTISKDPLKDSFVKICDQAGDDPETNLSIPSAAMYTNSEAYTAKVYDQYGAETTGMVNWALDKTYTGVELDTTTSTGNAILNVEKTADPGTIQLIATCSTPGSITVSQTLDITLANKTPAQVTTVPAAVENLKYNGTEQALVTAGTANGGTMQYSLGASHWSTAIPTAKDAATYTVQYRVVGDPAHTDTDPVTLTVTIGPKVLQSSDLEKSGGSATKAYDGTATSSITVRVKASSLYGTDTLPINGSAVYNSANVAEANEITFTPTAITTGNYRLAATEKLTINNASITPRDLIVTPNGGQNKKFGAEDPTLHSTNSGRVSDQIPDFTGALSRAEGEDVGQYDITLGTLALMDHFSSGFKASNYTLKMASPAVKFEITKADAPTLADIAVSQKYTVTTEQSKDIGNGGMPADAGTLTYREGTPALLTGSVTIDSGNVDTTTGKVTYKLSGGAAGDTVTLPVIIKSTNYADTTVNVVITLTAKDDQAALTLTGETTVVYGQTLQLGTSGGNGNGAVTYTVTPGTGTATIDATGKLTPTKVGTVTVTATKAADANYNAITSAPVTITITKATPTGEPKYTAITTSGKTLADAGLTTAGSNLSVPGTVKWVDDTGADLPATTTVEANTTYKWIFTPTDTNYTTLTGSIQLWHKSTSSGGGSYYAPTVPDMPMLYRGCTGDAVKTLQEKLNAKGFDSGNVDGIFGAKTYAAATAFQKANGLGVDGIVGKLTWAKLYDATPVNVTPVTTQPMLRTGSRGDAVRKLQELLNAKGYTCGSVDGIFGSKTYAAVLAFQKANGLAADGIVGSLTWGKLV